MCGDRLSGAQLLMGSGECVNCREHRPEFERAVFFGEYRDGLRRLVHMLKYERVTPVQSPLGKMLAEAVSQLLPAVADTRPLLVVVPLHKNRRRSRGFNQAELIARAAMRELKDKLEFEPGTLLRQRETVSQVGLSREERIENMRGAFRVSKTARLDGRSVIVVDDVMTTGTTLSECARVLKQAGAKEVWAATVARAFHGADFADAADDGEQEEVEAAAGASF